MKDHYVFKLHPYCDDCPEFEVKVNETRQTTFYPDIFDPLGKDHTFIVREVTCEHFERCGLMVNLLDDKKATNIRKEKPNE